MPTPPPPDQTGTHYATPYKLKKREFANMLSDKMTEPGISGEAFDKIAEKYIKLRGWHIPWKPMPWSRKKKEEQEGEQEEEQAKELLDYIKSKEGSNEQRRVNGQESAKA